MKLAPTPLAFRGRIIFLGGLMMVGFLAILGGYFKLQVVQRKRYEELGERYRLKNMPIRATRGYIYDRNGLLLAQNMPTYNLVLQRDEMETRWNVLRPQLSAFLGIPEDELQSRFAEGAGMLSKPVPLKTNLNYAETLRIKRNALHFSGLNIETTRKRFYNYSEMFSHVMGYVGEVSKAEMKRDAKLHMGQIVGKSGIELAYDDILTGKDGERTVHIDNRGLYRSEELTNLPIPGDDIYLTLDHDLQSLALQSMEGRGGSVVMMDVKTGEVLVYLSAPTFDLNLFNEGLSARKWQELNNAPSAPFLNRPVKGAYAPGSVFKVVTALAGLKLGKLTPTSEAYCSGSYTLSGHTARCHKEGGHGSVNLAQAIQYSCNVYFYTLAREMNIDDLAKVANDFGFGHTTGLDLVGENPGLMPNREWKRRRFKESWYPGETLSVAIGQGALQATPMQLVVLMSTIANDGVVPTPHLMLKHGKDDQFVKPIVKTRTVPDILPEHYALIKDAMWRVVNQDSGTGASARVAGMDVCGKTGTAQLANFKKDERKAADKLLNAWFAGFAPRDNPRVALIVLCEQSGHGGHRAAPIAKALLEAWRAKQEEVNPT